ncbi:nuclear transport factor 2 family protein [Catenulispora sp. NF23]|uniref:Nuclear transport factor 2 family protein n=1 Tax=Catenulispora pinistramenti TaxID=2705254 RepID=A0ABS5KSQ3_9ACTN|nr:nuclear transport factor 2 family protein [Catenulispora pinistramenti]MBS2538693.1 nuclear transport factor 2 family protein [Catenulispora pinistramenti]MBS2549066.1 nuclear transport factor 2 family protein [Catenulispora pinistramenti]
MNATTLPEIAIAWAAAWNGGNAGALGALFTADGAYTDHAIGATMTGQEQISGWKARTDAMIDDAAVKLVTAYRSGDRVTIEAVYSGHIKGAPTPFAVPMATLLDTRDDLLITADRDYYSLAAVLAQSGLPADWTPAS